MIELNDDQAQQIMQIVEDVRVRHMDGSEVNATKLHALHNELEGRLNDAGYKVTVDVTPLLEGAPPTVRIDDFTGDGMSDVERKLWDIAKRLDRGEDVPDIEGYV